MRAKRSVTMAVLIALAYLTGLAVGSAHAAAAFGLPVTNVYQVVADTAHNHLFISQGTAAGSGDNAIVVTDLSGNPVTTIGGQSGVAGLLLSPDGSTLYAALTTGQAVSAISTTTLAVTASYPLPTGDEAYAVSLQSGRLWVSYLATSPVPAGGIGTIDPANVNSFTADAVPGNWLRAPQIATDPMGGGVLATATVGVNPPAVATYDVSNPSAVTLTDSATSFASCGSPPHGLSVLRGGAAFLCDGAPYSTATLAPLTLPVAFSGPTVVAPTGTIADDNGTSILVYRADSTTAFDDYSLWYGLPLPSSFTLNSSAPVGFAWSADSSRLFAVIESTSNSDNPVFSVVSLYPFLLAKPDFTLTSTATTVGYGGSATLVPHLGVTYTNRSFALYETVAGQPRQQLWNGPADPSGSITVNGLFGSNTTFTAVFSGDARYAAKTVTVRIGVLVKIAAAAAGYYRSTRISGTTYRVYHHTATLKDAVTVTPNKHGECVRLQVQVYSHNAWQQPTFTPCVALNASSKAVLALKLHATGRFRARPQFLPAAKDIANVSSTGPWLYYLVTT
jgi:hypothetical protein